MSDELDDLRESLPALEAEVDETADAYREDPTDEEAREAYHKACKRLRWTRWKLRGATGPEPGADENQE